MSSNNKSDMSTSGSESPLFPTAPRGTAFLERPGSSRDSIANRIQSSALGTTRSAATSVHGDPVGLVQSIISDVKPVVPEKLPRPAEMKRIMGSFAGSISDELGPGRHLGVSKEEVKRTRSRLAEGSNKANERTKTFGQIISRIDKYFNNNPRKRSRGESLSDRPGGPSSGSGVSRAGQPSHSSNADESEMGPPKAERTKNQGQNRRARSSIAEMDARNIGASRSSGSVDKTKDISKINNRSSGEEKPPGLTANNSWEKPKMKKKRSASNSVGPIRLVDGDRERKQEVLPKLVGDARPKVTVPHSSRYGVSLAAGGSGKPDTEQGGLESPRPLPRGSQDGGALSINKRDRLGGFEIGNIKAINKLTDQEGSPTTSVSRANTSIRGPRSTPAAVPKASAGMFRTPDSDVWDQPSPSNKSGPSSGGASSSKRTKSVLSPSPPVTKWASHRPPKMSRVARRSNIVPIIGSQGGEPQMPDSLENKTMAVASQATHRIKKGDHAQSSSEESGAAVHKLKDNKRRRAVETEENNSLNSQRLGTAGHPLKKSKLVVEDDMGDVPVKKQGRGGRGFAPPRPGRPSSIEKPEANGTTTKQRSVRSGVEGSRPGRPPVKKFSERKGKTRPREVAIDSPMDISGQPEDDRDELLAAANAALAPGYASTDVLWKKNEPYFRSITDDDTSFLTTQAGSLEELIHCTEADEQDLSKKGNLSYVSLPSTPNGYGPFSNGGGTGMVAWQNDAVEPILQQLVQGMDAEPGAGSDIRSITNISICQKLLSAIISEEELERIERSNGRDSSILCPELEEGWLAHQESGRNQPHDGVRLDVLSVDRPYEQMTIDDRILLELSQIGIYPDPCEHVPDLEPTDEDDINDELAMLEARLAKQALERKVALTRIEQKAQAAKERQEREFSNLALDKLILKANEKYLSSRGKHGNRGARQSAMGFINRALARCKEFESNGTSCFDEQHSFKELLHNSVSKQSDITQNEDKSPQDLLHDKDEQWSTGVKKKELLLDDVVGNITGSVSLGSGVKGKRSERDARGNNKNGRGSSSNPKGDRKPKAKPKQRSASTSALLSNGTAELAPRSNNKKREGLPPLPTKPGSKQMEKETEEEMEALPDLSGLQLPDMDLEGESAGDGHDFWSGIDDGLQEVDCAGLDIPLDDLSDVKFCFG